VSQANGGSKRFRGASKTIASLLSGLMASTMFTSGLSGVAIAQSASDEPAANDSEGEIVVTARGRAERILDVPISIAAVPGDQLEAFGVGNFETLDVPGVLIERGGMSDTPAIRGIASGANLGFEQSAPLYVGGVYYGRGRMTRGAFLDLDGVEVLRGPQPIYYGKNAVAGAIGLRPRGPTADFEAGLRAFHEFNFNERALEGYVSGPLTDRMRGRLAARHRTSDGYLTNLLSGRDEPEVREFAGRAQLEFDVAGNFDLRFTAYGGATEDNGRNGQLIACSPIFYQNFGTMGVDDCTFDENKTSFGDVPDTADPAIPRFGDSNSFRNELEYRGGNIHAEWRISDALTVNSITAYYEFDSELAADADNGSRNVIAATFVENFRQFSQEVRATGERDRFNWMAGFYYDSNENYLDNYAVRNFAGAVPGGSFAAMAMQTGNITTYNREEAESWAVFGEAGFDLTDRLSASVGARYDEVTKSNTLTRCNAALFQIACTGPVSGFQDELQFDSFQPSVTVEWRPIADWMTFLSWRRGFKAGGFDFEASTLSSFTYEPEEAETFELGVRGTTPDDVLTIIATAFRTEVENLQQTGLNPDPAVLAVETFNVGALRSQGIEVEARARLNDYLSVSGSFVYLDAEFTSFPGAQCYALQTVEQGCVNSVTLQPVQDLTGRRPEMAPEYSGTFGISYEQPIGDRLRLFADSQVFFTEEYVTETDNDPNTIQDAYAKVDLTIGLGDVDDRWSLSLVGRNLTDELTASRIIDSPGSPGTYQAFTDVPRTIGIQGTLRY